MAQVSIGQPEEPASRWGYLRWLLGRGGADRDRSLDTQIQIVTPENIEFSYHVAGPFSRSLAFFLDFLIYWFACFVIAFTASLLFGLLIYPLFEELGISWLAEEIGNIGAGLYLVAFFASYFFYWGVCEARFNGRTIGKLVVGLRVVSTTGHPISGWQAVARTLVRMAESMPWAPTVLLQGPFLGYSALFGWDGEPVAMTFFWPTFLVCVLFMTCSSRFQRLGDLVCGTMVVYEHRGWKPGLAELEDERTPRLAEIIPPGFVVSREMARSLASYVHKRRYLTPLRRRDIARHLAEPLLRKFEMPADTSYDLLLCALYHRTFIAEQPGEGVRMASDRHARAASNVGNPSSPSASSTPATTTPATSTPATSTPPTPNPTSPPPQQGDMP